jgi:D-glycero-D-manno-heptose 1,7-bisphosphate phosphatase
VTPSPSGVAVFLDRDGTLIRDRNYLSDPEGVELVPGAAVAIGRLNRAGVPVVLVTNQSGIGRGMFGVREFQAVQQRISTLLAAADARLDAVYHCPHAPGEWPPCDCRKPADGLFRRAAADLGLDLGRCVFIGDRARDVAAAAPRGAMAILVPGEPPTGEPLPEHAVRADGLEAAVALALAAVGSD